MARHNAVARDFMHHVTESARAHGYYSVSTGMHIGDSRLYHFRPPGQKVSYTPSVVSENVFYTLPSVEKCIIQSIAVKKKSCTLHTQVGEDNATHY